MLFIYSLPINQNLLFVSRIVKAPSLDDEYDSRPTNAMDMDRPEELWRRGSQATLEDLDSPDYCEDDDVVEPVKLM